MVSDVYQFLSCGAYPEMTKPKDRRALRLLAPNLLFVGLPFIGDHLMPIIIMPRPRLCRSSDERGSCRSLWPTHGRSNANA